MKSVARLHTDTFTNEMVTELPGDRQPPRQFKGFERVTFWTLVNQSRLNFFYLHVESGSQTPVTTRLLFLMQRTLHRRLSEKKGSGIVPSIQNTLKRQSPYANHLHIFLVIFQSTV